MKETKTIRGKVGNVVAINSGTTDKGRKWVLFEVSIGGQTFRTFDSGYNDKIGQEGEWIFEEEERIAASGKSYTSRTLLPLSKMGKQSVPKLDQERLIKGLGIIRGDIKILKESMELKLGLLEGLLQAINIKVSGSSIEMDKRPELKTFRPDIEDKDIPIVENEKEEGPEEEIPF